VIIERGPWSSSLCFDEFKSECLYDCKLTWWIVRDGGAKVDQYVSTRLTVPSAE
jgi:hypothetical protein